MTTLTSRKLKKVDPPASLNAFVGKTEAPTIQELTKVLGPAKALWDKLVDDLQQKDVVNGQEWGSYSPKAGWSLRLKRKDRVIVYLIPFHGSFQVSLVLGDKAVKAARECKLPKRVQQIIDEARRYAEGTGIRLNIESAEDLLAVEQLALIKMNN